MSAHAETALDQLRLADDAIPEPTREQLRENALTAAVVHALLAVAEASRVSLAFAHPPAKPQECGALGWSTSPTRQCVAPEGHRGQHFGLTA